ncbi:MAG: zinc dependent phospholipase C family protein [Sedimentibacter sp.]|nr:zinc dependent phospholipase C family protein [Sedimentibacter sp.]
MLTIEGTYSLVYKNILRAVNPLKKRVVKTECIVHQAINNQSLHIIRNDGYFDVYNLMSTYMDDINDGVVWADQDLKSSNHFYSPRTKRGLYGNSNAKNECESYYNRALNEFIIGNIETAMFYLGAACHLVQDVTIPQHANVKLLKNHRSFENWMIKMYRRFHKFRAYDGGIYLNSISQYVEFNSRKAIKTHEKFSHIKNEHIRFYKISSVILVMAQRTTAGVMVKFYYDTQKLKAIMLAKLEKDN